MGINIYIIIVPGGGLITIGVIFYIIYFQLLHKNWDLLIVDILRVLSWFRISFYKLRKIRAAKEIEGFLEFSARGINNEADRVLPEKVTLKLVKEESEAELLRDGSVVLRVRKSEDRSTNIINATILLLNKTFLRFSRVFLGKAPYEAAKLVTAKRIVEETLERDVLEDFYMVHLKDPVERETLVGQYISYMERLENEGLFTRLFVYEIQRLGRFYTEIADPSRLNRVRREVAEFLEYTREIANKGSDEDVDLYHDKYFIKVAIVLIARKKTREALGVKPYIDAFQFILNNLTVSRIYLLARDTKNIEIAEKVGAYFERRRKVHCLFSDKYPHKIKKIPVICSCYSPKY